MNCSHSGCAATAFWKSSCRVQANRAWAGIMLAKDSNCTPAWLTKKCLRSVCQPARKMFCLRSP